MDNNKPTIVDVARLAKVSVATVSRVVNGKQIVKDKTRKIVEKAIKELNYVPNISARELTSGKKTTIGVVVPSVYNMFFAEVIDGIENRLSETEYSLILSCAHNDLEKEVDCINNLISRSVAGIIIISPNTRGMNVKLYEDIAKKTPLVFINGYYHIPGASYVTNDEALGIEEAILYLKELNHEKILLVRGENSDSYNIKELAFRNLLGETITNIDDYIVNIGLGNTKSTLDNSLLKLTEKIKSTDATAIVCCNDIMAIGAINACKKLNLKVPEDISIIGFDNIDIANYVTPPLTTVDQNMQELGISATNLLIEKISSNQVKRVILYNSLIKRKSTARKAMS